MKKKKKTLSKLGTYFNPLFACFLTIACHSTGHVAASSESTVLFPRATDAAVLVHEQRPTNRTSSAIIFNHNTAAPPVQPSHASAPPSSVQPLSCPRIPLLCMAAADVVAFDKLFILLARALAAASRPSTTDPATGHSGSNHQRATPASSHGSRHPPRQDRRISNRGCFNVNTTNKYHQEG